MLRMQFAAVVVAGLAMTASAEIVEFKIYENASGGDTSGLDLTVELIDGGSHVDFVFRNASTVQSVVTAVYFEDTVFTSGALVSGGIAAESAGVDFEDGASPSNPAQPGANYGGAWAGTHYAADAESPGPHNGVNETGAESVTVRFDYGNADFDAVVEALTGDPEQFRIAMHIQGVGDDEFSVWGTTVPAPGSLALLAGAGFIATRRRR